MVRHLARRVLCLLAVALALTTACRHERDDTDNSMTLSDPTREWFDSAGVAGQCDPPAKACAAYQDEKEFVDVCVAKGFQAKTCGCALRCSGKSGYVKPKAPASAAALALAATGPQGCAPDAVAVIASAVQARKPGSDLDHCIDSHVCNGNLGACTGDERLTTTRLRAFARQHCEGEVLSAFCKDASLDTMSCSDSDIAHLSRTYADAYSKDPEGKRCFRNVVCSGSPSGCAAEVLKAATETKALIDKDGCHYWLRLFCNLGAKKW